MVTGGMQDPLTASMNFVFGHAGVSSVIIGSINPEHIRANVAFAAGMRLSCDLNGELVAGMAGRTGSLAAVKVEPPDASVGPGAGIDFAVLGLFQISSLYQQHQFIPFF